MTITGDRVRARQGLGVPKILMGNFTRGQGINGWSRLHYPNARRVQGQESELQPRVVEQLFGSGSLLRHPSKHPFCKVNEQDFLMPGYDRSLVGEVEILARNEVRILERP